MLHTADAILGLERSELGPASRALRGRTLRNVIAAAGGVTVVCSDGTEVSLAWAGGAIEYNGYRSTLRHVGAETPVPDGARSLVGKRLDSFQAVGDRGYLVAEGGEALRIEAEDGAVALTPVRAVRIEGI